MAGFLSKLLTFGEGKQLKNYQALADKIGGLEPEMQAKSDEQLRAFTDELRSRVQAGASTADVLPEIADAVGGRVKILVDGGIRSGTDIFRALALGADAVMICRPFLISYYGGGTEGIVAYVEKLRAELTDAMYMCGARSLGDITRDMVRAVR